MPKPEMLSDVMDVVKLKPSHDVITWAKGERRRLDKLVGTGIRPGDIAPSAGRDRRWIGAMAERMFDDWLDGTGLTHEHNGGVDDLPDFVIEGSPVAVKCCHGLMYSDFFVFVNKRQQKSLHEYLFFTGYNSRENILNLIGGMKTEEFFELATAVKRGQQYATTHDRVMPTTCYRLPARNLIPCMTFLTNILTANPDGWAEMPGV